MQRKIFTAAIMKKLIANGAASAAAIEKDGNTPDHVPVIKVFNPWGCQTWLFTEYHPESDSLFGLCDLGFGEPELGYVSMAEIEAFGRDSLRRPLERDAHFSSDCPISIFADAARRARRIVETFEIPATIDDEPAAPVETVEEPATAPTATYAAPFGLGSILSFNVKYGA